MPGQVLEVLVSAGDTVAAGEPLVRMESMKLQLTVPAPGDGTVAEVRCAEAVGVAQAADRPAWLLYPARRPGFRFETGHRSELKPR